MPFIRHSTRTAGAQGIDTEHSETGSCQKAKEDGGKPGVRFLARSKRLPRPEDLPPSEAKVQAAKANADRARDEYQRTKALWSRRAVSDEEAVGKRLLHEEAAQ